MHNLLADPLIATLPHGPHTLPGVMAALAGDEIDGYPALRAHQRMFWHMFLVQLAAMALRRARCADIPPDEDAWRRLLRAMTPDHPGDEPWHLVVDDRTRPGFMQPPVPENVQLKNEASTPDALDLLITSKNHDLKQAVAANAAPQDWIFALIALQTGGGYDGAGNYGIARMNGGSSSRAMLTLAPCCGDTAFIREPRHGPWFRREVLRLLTDYAPPEHLDYPKTGGIGLTWLSPWPEGGQLATKQLDPLFIEVCRRVRLFQRGGRLIAERGTSKAQRINAKAMKGNLGDPWAPVERTGAKSLTIGEAGTFDYRKMTELLLGGEWKLPLLARPASQDTPDTRLMLVAEAIGRGNSKTGGMKSRSLPVSGGTVQSLFRQRETLGELAAEQMKDIKDFSKALGAAVVMAIAGGDKKRIKDSYSFSSLEGMPQQGGDKKRIKDSYSFARPAEARLDRLADARFFEFLWKRFERASPAARKEIRGEFRRILWKETCKIFDDTLPTLPGSSLLRPRAEVLARRKLKDSVMNSFGDDLKAKERNHAG